MDLTTWIWIIGTVAVLLVLLSYGLVSQKPKEKNVIQRLTALRENRGVTNVVKWLGKHVARYVPVATFILGIIVAISLESLPWPAAVVAILGTVLVFLINEHMRDASFALIQTTRSHKRKACSVVAQDLRRIAPPASPMRHSGTKAVLAGIDPVCLQIVRRTSTPA